MGEVKDNDYEEELVDFEDDDPKALDSASAKTPTESVKRFVSFYFIFYFVIPAWLLRKSCERKKIIFLNIISDPTSVFC
jgi:hypothetical protein